MSDKNKRKSRRVYFAKEKSMKQAVEFVQNRLSNNKRSWDNENYEKNHKIKQHCTSTSLLRISDYVSFTGFSKSLFMLEIRSHLGKQNWKHIQHLYPLLLDYSNEIEYLIWRYALIIFLYSPNSDSSNLQQFLEICIGNHRLNDRKELERLLLLECRNLINS
ncbi:PREDICTED: uncharacterized protein LOC106793960 [Polistes canadensis]|uniref:uncharacterized protein LOC106793960 n=1 Tax=Polistes canadensis TaxID=91411 RepID=UPI000719051D|nr:PREDICTED: uncharacterized protein LOC106793960 [Polistes canadensis]KAI4484778.1 hypothetical protein M0804_007344 [Polistes exclamans]